MTIPNFIQEEYNEIQRLHISYLDYRLFVEPSFKHIVNFNDYINKFHSRNKIYYHKLAEKYNFELDK